MNEEGFLAAMGSLGPEHPVRRALEWKLARIVEMETTYLVMPGLADEARHYNAGRLAMALDVGAALGISKGTG